MRKYGIALIGCGAMGAAHLDNICHKENVILESVCDIRENRAEHFAEKYHANRYDTDWKAAIANKNVDIVVVAVYPSMHLEIVKECIRIGKHVLCEKPISNNLEKGRELVDLIKAHPETKVLVGYILRHNKTYQYVANMIQSGAIGSPIVMRMAQNHHTMDWEKYRNLIIDTSPIVDCGVHYLDVMRWFTGAEITSISGMGLKTEADLPKGSYNYGMINIKMSDGSIAYYEAGWGNTMSSDNLKEFIGPKGRIRITYQMNRTQNNEEGDLIEYYTYPEKKYEIINNLCERKPTDDQLQALIDMIETDCPANPDIDDVWQSFLWANRADEIIRQNLDNDYNG